MKVELKSFKWFPSMSEETNAFTANVVINGKKVGTARNDGHGGMTDLHFSDPQIGKDFSAWALAQPPSVSEHGTLEMTADFFIDLLVDALIETQELKKEQKRLAKIKSAMIERGFPTTLQIIQNDSYVCVGVKIMSDAVIQQMAAKYKVDAKCIVVI